MIDILKKRLRAFLEIGLLLFSLTACVSEKNNSKESQALTSVQESESVESTEPAKDCESAKASEEAPAVPDASTEEAEKGEEDMNKPDNEKLIGNDSAVIAPKEDSSSEPTGETAQPGGPGGPYPDRKTE